jgi:hypothetical protein
MINNIFLSNGFKKLSNKELDNNFIELRTSSGWAAYYDTQYTSDSPLSISADTATLIPNNAGITFDKQKPKDINTFYNKDTQKVVGLEGDAILANGRFKIRPTNSSASYADFWFQVNGSTAYEETISFPKGEGQVKHVNLSEGMFINEDWANLGGSLYIKSNGPVELFDISYLFIRAHKAR